MVESARTATGTALRVRASHLVAHGASAKLLAAHLIGASRAEQKAFSVKAHTAKAAQTPWAVTAVERHRTTMGDAISVLAALARMQEAATTLPTPSIGPRNFAFDTVTCPLVRVVGAGKRTP